MRRAVTPEAIMPVDGAAILYRGSDAAPALPADARPAPAAALVPAAARRLLIG